MCGSELHDQLISRDDFDYFSKQSYAHDVQSITSFYTLVGLRSSYLKLHSKSNLDQVQRKAKHKKGLRLLSLLQLGEFTTEDNTIIIA